MDATFKPFMTIVEVCGGNPLTELQFSSSGDSFLIASATYQLLIYSRDGNLLSETVRGDPYLRDYKKTKGHTAAITGCQWHPLDKNVFMTTSVDSTIRIWHKDKCRGGNTAVISVKPKIAGSRSPVTAACYTPDGLKIIAGMQDGSIHVWPSIGPFIKPLIVFLFNLDYRKRAYERLRSIEHYSL